MTTATESRSRRISVTRLAVHGVLAAITACFANVFVRVVATSLLDVPPGFEPLGWGPIVNTTVVGVAGATIVYGVLVRATERPDRYFRSIALVVLLLSFVPLVVPPAFLSGASWTLLGTLAVMHVTTAAAVLGLLPRAAPGARAEVPTG